MSVIAMLLAPLAGAALSCVPDHRRAAPAATVICAFVTLALALRLALQVAAAGRVTAVAHWIEIDGLSAIIVLLVALVGTMAALFSAGYLERTLQPERLWMYYANYNLFFFSILAIPVLTEPTLVWIVVELTTVCSAMLVSFSNTRYALEGAWKYVVLSLMGAAVALLGFLVLYAAMLAGGGKDYTWDGLTLAAPHIPAILLEAAFLLILIGLGAKVGLAPMHTWMPDAYSQAPSPVCAMLSGIETTAILYVILRLAPILNASSASHGQAWAVIFGLISVGTAAFLLLQVRDYKRMFAFSTVEHMGIILTAVGLGAPAARYAALYQIVCHSLAKSLCFLAAGATLLTAGSTQISSVRGLIRRSPIVGASLLIGGLAVAGAPPFAIFLSEFSIFRAGLAGGQYVATGLLMLFAAIAFMGIALRVNQMVFGGIPKGQAAPARLSNACAAPLVVGGLLVLWFGLYLPAPIQTLLRLGAAVLNR